MTSKVPWTIQAGIILRHSAKMDTQKEDDDDMMWFFIIVFCIVIPFMNLVVFGD